MSRYDDELKAGMGRASVNRDLADLRLLMDRKMGCSSESVARCLGRLWTFDKDALVGLVSEMYASRRTNIRLVRMQDSTIRVLFGNVSNLLAGNELLHYLASDSWLVTVDRPDACLEVATLSEDGVDVVSGVPWFQRVLDRLCSDVVRVSGGDPDYIGHLKEVQSRAIRRMEMHHRLAQLRKGEKRRLKMSNDIEMDDMVDILGQLWEVSEEETVEAIGEMYDKQWIPLRVTENSEEGIAEVFGNAQTMLEGKVARYDPDADWLVVDYSGGDNDLVTYTLCRDDEAVYWSKFDTLQDMDPEFTGPDDLIYSVSLMLEDSGDLDQAYRLCSRHLKELEGSDE